MYFLYFDYVSPWSHRSNHRVEYFGGGNDFYGPGSGHSMTTKAMVKKPAALCGLVVDTDF